MAGAALTMALVGWPLWQQGLKAPTLSMARPSVPSVTSPKDSEVGSRQDSTTSAVPLGGNRTNVASLPTQVRTEGNTLILPSQHPVRLDAAKLVAGQTVRSKPGSRARIVVPPGGIVIGVEDVTFENVDFVWDSAQAVTANDNETTPLVRLEALGATFRGCGFRVTKAYFKRPTAIYWNTGTRSHDETSLPTGVLKITDCVFEGLAAGIDCRTNGALVFEIENSLHLGPGPLIHLKRIPRVDEPVVADLRRFTLRAAAGLMAFPTDQLTETPGQVRVQATDCAFAPDDEGALFLFNSTDHPCRILETLEWTGQGSLLASGAALARWRHDVGTSEDIADDAIDVAGLVRSEVEFAGEADAGPAASRVTRWQVPLRSTDPPGFGELPEGISGTNR